MGTVESPFHRYGLTIVQNWVAMGMPPGPAVLGSFEAWAQTLSGILDCAGLQGLLENRKDFLNAHDADANAWSPLIELWLEEYGEQPVMSVDVLDLMDQLDFPPVALKSDDRKSNARMVASVLKKNTQRSFAGYFINSLGKDGHDKMARWSLSEEAA